MGGDPDIKDTVLFNHQQAEQGGAARGEPNIHAILYDYTIQADDLADGIDLLPLGQSHMAELI